MNRRDQFVRIDEGEGTVDLHGVANVVSEDIAVIAPAGANHNVRNKSGRPLRLFARVCTSPEHPVGIVKATKSEADARHHHGAWDGKAT